MKPDSRIRPRIVGVLNVTPDSFHAESRVQTMDAVLTRAAEMISQGADLLEVGGESTGPGSPDVSPEAEIRRTVPAVAALGKRFPGTPIVVDTWKALVAAEALKSGASMINDVTAGRGDAAMFSTAAKAGCGIVLMYSKDPSPRTTVQDVRYDDVIGTIHEFLKERKAAAVASGISPDRIIVDPGLGHFVSCAPEYSFEILARLSGFADLGPVLVSPSRKSFLAGPGKLPTAERLWPTVAASALAALSGAAFIRTHDCRHVKQALDRIVSLPRYGR